MTTGKKMVWPIVVIMQDKQKHAYLIDGTVPFVSLHTLNISFPLTF